MMGLLNLVITSMNATIEVYLFLAETISDRRGFLNPKSPEKKSKYFFFRGSRFVPIGHGIFRQFFFLQILFL